MEKTVPEGHGAMAAIIGLTNEDVQTLCHEASSDSSQVTPANYNAIGQVVIAGHTAAVEKAMQLAEVNGARMAKRIPVSVPCHCSLMNEAAFQFEEFLQQAPFKSPNLPVISNVDLTRYESADQIRQLLKEQLYSPVRWVETIQIMQASGINGVIESGPGKVLSGLVKRIDKSLVTWNVNDTASLNVVLANV
jgi:[acyl-carrier-protein] S-malonyltransferase